MRGYWTQPSLSRDFALLSAAILFLLFFISGWITYTTYSRHANHIATDMAKESERIERALASEMDSANYLLSALGKQIILDKDRDLVRLALTLKSFDSKGYIYSIFSWVSPDQHVVVSSNRGVLDTPVDVSDRDYVKKAMAEPWKMYIGRPIEGRTSERWVIPVALGLTDYTGKFIGTIQVSIDINTLTERLSNLVRRDGISFAIVSKTLIPLTQVSDDKDFVTKNFPTEKLTNVNFSNSPSGLIAQGSLFWGTGNYSYYRVSNDYPYIILLGYDSRYTDDAMHGMLWSRLLQMFVIAAFLVLFLWIMRVRMIKPVLDMTVAASAVAKGQTQLPLPIGGPVEIEGLAVQIRRISEYIAETKRIEDELRNKMFMLKKAKERAEISRHSKSEFLAYVCQEMRNPLNNIIGFAQVMRDQLYGPIENRKYRQYAADIYQTGNGLLNNLQDLLTLSKIETENVMLMEKPLVLADVINKAQRTVADKFQADKITVKVKLQEPMPRLNGDEFRLQQIVVNLLLSASHHLRPGNEVISLEGRIINENRETPYLALVIAAGEQMPYSPTELTMLIEQITAGSLPQNSVYEYKAEDTQVDLGLELAKWLIDAHQGYLHVDTSRDTFSLIVLLGNNRFLPDEEQE